MYSAIKNVQILVGLLKKHGVRHIVVSPGGSSIPIVHSVENDDFFTCYSVIDERSAAYFALGASQHTGEPVAAVCTSGTAVCNYLPAVTEARYQNVPLLLITADKHPYYDKQLVVQVINQINIYQDKVKHSVSLPYQINNNDELWYCQRLINEALLELNHHGAGPVHINIPTIGSQTDFSVKELPEVTAVNRVSYDSSVSAWLDKVAELASSKRILVVFGQHGAYSERAVQCMERFAEKYNCVLSVEHISNVKCKGTLQTYPVIETSPRYAAKVTPADLVISLGGNFATYQLRNYIGAMKGSIKHWVIEESGYVKDPFKKLTDIFECTPDYFFEFFSSHASDECQNDQAYYNEWKKLLDSVEVGVLPFSNFYVAQGLAKHIPNNSLLHLSILSSTRHMQFFDLDQSICVYSNLGALGIDGSMSSFMGQASVSDDLAFLLIGDLSFFYDMNSAGIRHVGNNVRILLANNTGASEFHFYIGKDNISTLDDYVSAKHGHTAKAWVESCGFKYLSASNKEEYDIAVTEFVSDEHDRPVLLEVLTDMEEDAKVTRAIYESYKEESPEDVNKRRLKYFASAIMGEKNANKLAQLAKNMKNI